MDPRYSDPPQHCRRRLGVLLHVVPKGTSIQKLVLVESHRWAIEDSFETTKNELGLDHNKTRSWQAGIAMSYLSCLPSPSWASSVLEPTPRPKKRDRGLDRSIVLDPLIDPGNQAHCPEARPATHLACTPTCLVVETQGSSSQRSHGPSQNKIATVVQGRSSAVSARRLAPSTM
jgi:hypothetical protein